MLIGQATINLSANILSALLGLLSVFIFTRLLTPHDYGIYLLGVGFATVASVFLAGWFRNTILIGHARNDGTDVRSGVLSGYFLVCLSAPLIYGVGRLVGLESSVATAAVSLAIAIGIFELTQDLLRSRLLAVAAMKTTLVRAIMALSLGVAFTIFDRNGIVLLFAATLAYLIAVLVQTTRTWYGTKWTFDRVSLMAAAAHGWPLTLSLTLLAISSVVDRFMIANLIGETEAGRYVASLDLVRQTLMMPAISAAAAFFPLAVNIYANKGAGAVRSHLSECIELLFAIIIPACLGFALISSHIANVLLGAEFREVAAVTIPIVTVAVIFQILTQQYLHVSFLLSKRNSFYLINTASIIVVNVVLSFALISKYGVAGAAWARLGADAFGFACALILSRRAFPIPLPFARLGLILIAGLLMALPIKLLDSYFVMPDFLACIVLVCVGIVSYAALIWLFDISQCRGRLTIGVSIFRSKLARWSAR